MDRRKAKTCLLALAVLALALACVAGLYAGRIQPDAQAAEEDPEASLCERLAFTVPADGGGSPERIACVPVGDTCCVFLPAYADMARVTVSLRSGVALYLDGTPLADGMGCGDFPLGRTLVLSGEGLGSTPMVFLRSANVATLFVRTRSGSMDAVHGDKSLKEEAALTLYGADGSLDYQTLGVDKIRGHGQSSWQLQKKSYNLYLDYSAGLLGMGAARKWIIIANLTDRSNLRNWMVYTVARTLGGYDGFAPDCRFVDVYLNGQYNGLYLLCEKVEIHPNRLNVNPQSWLFDFDQVTRWKTLSNPFRFGKGIAVEIKKPADCTDEQKQALKARLTAFQDALLADDGVNPQTGMAWTDYIDLDSFARKYLVEEIFQNLDAGSCSQFYCWNADDDRIYAGPCWDYDYILGNSKQRTPNCFLARREWKTPKIHTPWFGALWRHEAFRDRVIELYRTEFRPALVALAETGLPGEARTLQAALDLNHIRWYDVPLDDPDSAKYVARLLDYLEKRLAFLDSAWIDGVDYKTITFRLGDEEQYQFYCLPAGSPCTDIPTPADYRLDDDWYWIQEDGTPFDPEAILTEDLYLVACVWGG